MLVAIKSILKAQSISILGLFVYHMLSQLYQPHEGGDCVLLYFSFPNKHSVYFFVVVVE